MTPTPKQAEMAQVAFGLGPSAVQCLFGFSGDDPRPYSELPFAPRLELFRAHLLLGGQQIGRSGTMEPGAKLTEKGKALRAHLSAQGEEE